MNLIVLHGNGVVGISNRISTIKKEFDPLSVSEFSGKKKSLDNALPEISTGGLFSEKRLVILEEFDPSTSSGQLGTDLEKLPEDENLTLVLKFSKQLASNSVILKNAVKLKAQIINITEKDETSIFPFLDALAEKKSSAMGQLDELLKEYGGQYILTMIFFMLRRLVNPPKNLPPFVIKKIELQRKNFDLEKIKKLYKTGIETDFKIKKGLLEEKIGITLLINKILTN